MKFNSREILLAWAAGLFEGEGYIRVAPGISVAIEMTDLDVLESFHDNFGGSLITQKLRKSYKPTWKWALHGKEALAFIKEILPFLHKRRSEKVNEAIVWYEAVLEKQKINSARVSKLRSDVVKLRKTGLKHREISIRLNIERSYVTQILNGKYGGVRELENPVDCESIIGEIETRTSPQNESKDSLMPRSSTG